MKNIEVKRALKMARKVERDILKLEYALKTSRWKPVYKCSKCNTPLSIKEIEDRCRLGINLKEECECDKCWYAWFEKEVAI